MKNRVLIVIMLAAVLLSGAITFSVQADERVGIFVNGQEIDADIPGQIINDRVMVPVRFVTEALGGRVEWNEFHKRVIITTEPELKLMKLADEATTWPYWYENGKLYLEYRNMLQLVREYYPHPSYVPNFFKSSNTFVFNNKTIDLSAQQKGDFHVVAIDELKKAGIINYTWDEKNGNLTFKDPGK
ncbi:copper amine oxidase N-terminal domain-containing protein [Syntrophomonas curvata]